MKYRHLAYLISAFVLLGLIDHNLSKKEKSLPDSTEDASALGRLEWELMRLRDPLTGRIPEDMRRKELAFSSTLPNDASGAAFKAGASIWAPRGPWNVGGRTRAFALDVTNENILLAGTPSGGMWRSTDGGQNWTMVTPANNGQKNVSCLAQDTRPGKENVWYYGSGEAYGASAGFPSGYFLGDGMYKSIDSGKTWTALPSTVSGTPQSFSTYDLCWNIATNPADTINDVVYAAIPGGIYISKDGGSVWARILGTNATGSYSYYTDVQVASEGVTYATLSSSGSQKGIWRSTDDSSFINITPAGFPATYERLVIGISPSDETQLYILGHTPGYGKSDTTFLKEVVWNSLWKYKYISGDGSGAGGIWQDLSSSLPTKGGPFDGYYSQGSYDITVKVKPTDTNTVFIGGTNLYRSTNGFQDTTQTTFIGGYLEGTDRPQVKRYTNHHPDQHAIAFLPSNPDVMYSAHDGGISKTLNNSDSSVTWTSLNNGYLTTMFYTVAIDHAVANSNVLVGGAQDNGTWFTNNANLSSPWVETKGGDGSFCAVADSQKMFYCSSQNANILKIQLDSSGNKIAYNRIDPVGGGKYSFIAPFALDPNNNNIMYLAGGKYIWRNDDLSGIALLNELDPISTNWVKYNDSVPISGAIVSALNICKTPANRLYYGTNSRNLYRVDNADGSVNTTDITGNGVAAFFPSLGYISSIAVDPDNGDKLMVTFANYNAYSVFYSSDAGSTWSKVAGNLEQTSNGSGNGPSIRWGSILPVSDGTVYIVATSTGVYATDSLNGINTVWVQQATDVIGNSICDMVVTRLSDGLVAVATHSQGIFTTNITSKNDIVTIKDIEKGKQNLSLTNFPNPFTYQTNIEFLLVENTTTSLYILDELGREVKLLVDNEKLPAGKHSYTFSGSAHLSKGIYYCVLKAGRGVEVRKLIFI